MNFVFGLNLWCDAIKQLEDFIQRSSVDLLVYLQIDVNNSGLPEDGAVLQAGEYGVVHAAFALNDDLTDLCTTIDVI